MVGLKEGEVVKKVVAVMLMQLRGPEARLWM